MALPNPSHPADANALVHLVKRLHGKVRRQLEDHWADGPYDIASVRDTTDDGAVEDLLRAYPGVQAPTLHGIAPDSLISPVTLVAVPRAAYRVLERLRERQLLWLEDHGHAGGPVSSEQPTTRDDFGRALLLELTHPCRDGSPELVDAAREALPLVGFEAVCRFLLSLGPVADDGLPAVAAALRGFAAPAGRP